MVVRGREGGRSLDFGARPAARALTISIPRLVSHLSMPTQKPTPSSNDSDPEEEPFLPSADEAIDLVKASGFAFPPNTHPTLLSQIPESNPGYVAEMRESSNILGLGPSEDVGEVFKAIILVSGRLAAVVDGRLAEGDRLLMMCTLCCAAEVCRLSRSRSSTSQWTCPSAILCSSLLEAERPPADSHMLPLDIE
jgi:hypothetical protein